MTKNGNGQEKRETGGRGGVSNDRAWNKSNAVVGTARIGGRILL